MLNIDSQMHKKLLLVTEISFLTKLFSIVLKLTIIDNFQFPYIYLNLKNNCCVIIENEFMLEAIEAN